MKDLNYLIEAAKKFAEEKINTFPESISYHDIQFANNLQMYVSKIAGHVEIQESEKQIAQIGLWLIAASYGKSAPLIKNNVLIYPNLEKESLQNLELFRKSNDLDDTIVKDLESAFKEVFLPNIPMTKLGMLIADSISADIAMGDGSKKLKKLYKELLHSDGNISKEKWSDVNLQIVKSFKFHLPYCMGEIQPLLNKLLSDLEKKRIKIDQNSETNALKKELGISDSEFKQLKNKISDDSKLDTKAIQTLFRIISKNHYTLNVMVDRKAHIMITVNSIILSLVIGKSIGTLGIENAQLSLIQNIPMIIVAIAALFSVIFAVLSIRPGLTHGEFTEEDIRDKKGNLLYYGNFHNMQMRDYEWAFLQMMNDRDYLYSSMIKDIYFLGQQLNKKYFHIRIALNIFLIGVVLAVVSTVIVSFL